MFFGIFWGFLWEGQVLVGFLWLGSLTSYLVDSVASFLFKDFVFHCVFYQQRTVIRVRHACCLTSPSLEPKIQKLRHFICSLALHERTKKGANKKELPGVSKGPVLFGGF